MDVTGDVREACRLCLSRDGNISVFDNTITQENIYQCVSVKITKDDELPKGVCEKCLDNVVSWCSFKTVCDQTQEKLQKWLVNCNLESESQKDDDCTLIPIEEVKSSSLNAEQISSEKCSSDLNSLSIGSERGLELSSDNGDSNGKENNNECLPHISLVLPNNESLPNEERTNELSTNRQQIPETSDDSPCTVEAMDVSENENEGETLDSVYVDSSVVNTKQSEAQNNSVSSNCKYVNVKSNDSPIENSELKGEGLINSSDSLSKPDITTDATSDQIIDESDKNNLGSTCGSTKTDEGSTSNEGKCEPESVGVCSTDQQNLQSAESSRSETSLDSDKENAKPNSPLNEKDNTKEKPDAEVNENSGDADCQATFSDIKIEFTSTCESDVYFSSFPECGSQGQNQNSEAQSASGVPCKAIDDQEIVDVPEDVEMTSENNNSEQLEQIEREEVAEMASETAEEVGVTSSSCATEDKIDRPPASQSPTESEKNAEFASSIVQIKQEPDDGTPDDSTIQPLSYVRVKTEFSSLDYEEELNVYPDGRAFSSGGALSPIDPTQTECFICNRKYSTASNYRQHLQTKVHLFNAAQLSGNSIEDMMTEEPQVDSPLLRSRLSSESLNSSGNQLTMQYTPGTVSPKKKPEGCKLCNVSFIYTSELRRHLQSKKHLANERLFRDGELPPSPDQASSENSSANDSRSIFICPIEKCHFSCVTGGNLLAHMKIHGIEQPESKGGEQSNNLHKPKLSLRQQDIIKKESERRIMTIEQLQQDFADQGEFECEGCGKLFLRESGLKKHTYYCTALRPEEFKDDIEAEDDMEEEEPVEVSSNEGDDSKPQTMHHCPLCDLSFTARNVFINHVQIYHKGSNLENGLLKSKKPVPKPVTKAPFLQVSNKTRITNKTHGFMCDICGKKFNLLSSLNYHLKTHTVGVKHICRICKEPFNARKSFMEHCRRHFLKPGSKETLCHKCFKVFKTRSELYYHRKNDMCSIKLKIFSCNLCQHSFKEADALEEHKVRFHSESLDLADDDMHSSSVGELYDDNYIPLNPLDVLSTHDSLPGTSSKVLPNYNKNANSYSKNTSNYNNRTLGGINTGQSSKPRSPFHCDICGTDYASMQSLKKHIKKFHILNKPFTGRKYSTLKKVNILQANYLKQWKCQHCKQGFSSRKILVFHLKRCQYNALGLEKGRCLQCGNWCESGKTRICRYCLPEITKISRSKPNTVTGPDLINYHPSKFMQQEFIGHPMPNSSNQDIQEYQMPYSDMSLYHQQQIGRSNEILRKFDVNNIPRSSSSRSNQNLSMSDIRLMKCPLGNKYFRNEVLMVKHYSQCDGSCENRCSHCRKMFNSPKEYKLHLINARCFGPKKVPTKYSSFTPKKKADPEDEGMDKSEFDNKRKFFTLTGSVDGSTDKIPDDSSDITLDASSLSEDINYGQDISTTAVTTIAEEKSLKIGRVCTICNKVISMQRAIYRHVYNCFKVAMLSRDSVSCQKCYKTFSKQLSMKENTTAIKQHVLSCHFIPYFVGEGLREDGSRLNIPPPLLCYVCSFGFSNNTSLQRHIKDHRTRKDDVNNIVLQLEDELLSDERLANEKNILSLYVESEITNQTYSVKMGRVLSLQDTPPPIMKTSKKFFQCDRCLRRFTNKNKFLRHKKVHGIVTQSVLPEVSNNLMDLMTTNTSPDN